MTQQRLSRVKTKQVAFTVKLPANAAKALSEDGAKQHRKRSPHAAYILLCYLKDSGAL